MVHDRQAADAVRAQERLGLGDGRVGRDRHRIDGHEVADAERDGRGHRYASVRESGLETTIRPQA